VNFPRVILALVLIGAVAIIGGWGIVTVLRTNSMTQSQRTMAISGIVIVVAALLAWVIFVWPAYWD
jgi:hypothetical protein